jgi:signal recognition particle subunit SRP54
MGPIKNLLGMIPGIQSAGIDLDNDINENAMVHIEAIIYSMTPKERRDPSILNGSRKKRIALGSGRNIQEVNKLLKQFEEMKKMMKLMTSNKKKMSLFGR